MSKKTLIIIIAVLAVILVAGIVTIFVLPNPTTPNSGDHLVSSDPAAQETDEPALETDVVGEDMPAAATEDPSVMDTQETAGEDDPTHPTKEPDVADPTTAPEKDPTTPTKNNNPANDPTKPSQSTQPTTPKPTTPQPTEPEETGPLIPGMEDVDVPDSDTVTYEEYYAMSADEQASFINSFESIEAFFAWHTAAKKEYESGRVEIDGSTPIDLGDIVGGN